MKTPTKTLVSELVRNVKSYTALSLLIFALSAAMGFALVASTGTEVGDIQEQSNVLVARGSNVWSVQTEEPFAASKCDGLRYVEGIADAGAPLHRWNASIDELPGSSVQAINATSGYIRIAWNNDQINGSLGVGSEISSALGLRLGARYTFVDEAHTSAAVPLQVSDVQSPSMRVRGADQLVMISSLPTGTVQECLVEADPGAVTAVEGLLLSKFGSAATISPLVQSDPTARSPENRLQTRLTLWIPIALALLAVVFVSVVQFLRRADWALYRLLGINRAGILLMLTGEVAITMWLPFAMGAVAGLLAVAISPLHGDLVRSAIALDLIRSGLLLLFAPVIAFLAISRSVTNTLKGQ